LQTELKLYIETVTLDIYILENLRRILKELGQPKSIQKLPKNDLGNSNNNVVNENGVAKTTLNPFSKETILAFLNISQIDFNFEVKLI
jgi:hypothetical protein